MSQIFIVDIEAYKTTATAGTVTLRYSYQKEITIGGNLYKPWVEKPLIFGQSISLDSSFGGNFSSTSGEITLINRERILDVLATDYIFAGKTITLKMYDTVSLTTTILSVQKMESPTFEWNRISIPLANEADKLDKPLQTKLYLGNNTLPAGVEGITELKDKPKPIALGRCTNISPVLVNTSKLIYQVSSEPCEQIVSVMSNGAYVSFGSVQGTLANLLLDTNAPNAGYYSWYSGAEGTFFRLAMESGDVTCTVWEKISPIFNSVSAIIQRVLTLAGYTSANWNAADFTYIDSLQGDSLGYFVSDTTTITDILNQLCQSISVWWGFDYTGIFRLFYFGDFTTTQLADIKFNSSGNTQGITSLDISGASYNGKTAPVKEIKLNYDKNWTVQDKASIAGIIVTDYPDRATWLGQEFRKISSSVTVTGLTNAQIMEYETLLVSEFAAKAEVDRLLALTSTQKFFYNCVAVLTLNELKSLVPCGIVKITLPRYDLAAGKTLMIISMEIDYEYLTANLVLWG